MMRDKEILMEEYCVIFYDENGNIKEEFRFGTVSEIMEEYNSREIDVIDVVLVGM